VYIYVYACMYVCIYIQRSQVKINRTPALAAAHAAARGAAYEYLRLQRDICLRILLGLDI